MKKIETSLLTVEVENGDKSNGYGGIDLVSDFDSLSSTKDTFSQRTDYFTFAVVQGAKAAAAAYAGQKIGIEYLGLTSNQLAALSIAWTALTYTNNAKDGKLSWEQKIYTDQDRSFSNTTILIEAKADAIFYSLIIQ